MKIRIAELIISIQNRYSLLEEYCEDYLEDDSAGEAFSVCASPDEIQKEMMDTAGMIRPDAEFVCVYRRIGFRLMDYDGLILHAVVVDFAGCGIAVLAPSGTGKTTLAENILAEYGEKARIINGDKPVVRFVRGRLMAYGTPWNGKEGYGCNDCVELKKLCFLEQGSVNNLTRIDLAETAGLLFGQLLVPDSEDGIDRFFGLVERILDATDCYKLTCTKAQSAAVTAIEGMGVC